MPRSTLCTPSDHHISRRKWFGTAAGAEYTVEMPKSEAT